MDDRELQDYSAIYQIYGSPMEAASQMLEGIDEDEIRRQKRKTRFTVAGVLVAFIIVISVLGTFAADAWSKFYQPGTTVVVTDEPKNLWVEENDK